MTSRIGELDLKEAAEQAAGNWCHFQCFVWYRDDIDDGENWAIIYTHNRDSGLLDQSNASVIEKALESFTEVDDDDPDVVMESHNHWAVGHVDGFSIRVFHDGQITDAFRKYHELAERLAEYPILNEEDYSNRELEATIENIGDAAWRVKEEYELPDDWQWEVYGWLSDNRCARSKTPTIKAAIPAKNRFVPHSPHWNIHSWSWHRTGHRQEGRQNNKPCNQGIERWTFSTVSRQALKRCSTPWRT